VNRASVLSESPRLSLTLLGLSYALVGWNLSAHHVIWFASFFIVVLAIISSWATSEWNSPLLGNVPIVLLIATAISLFVTLTLISSIFLTLGFIPILTTLFAWQEMRFWKFSRSYTFLTLTSVALLGLGLGELLDLTLLPSIRF
jgi:hypothetical protein